jgi:hypothetical protein
MEEGRIAFKILTGKSTEKRSLGWPSRRLENNIKMDLKEIGINTRNWVDSAQDKDYWRALVNAGTISHGVSELVSYSYKVNCPCLVVT